jgi:hypothetical protein
VAKVTREEEIALPAQFARQCVIKLCLGIVVNGDSEREVLVTLERRQCDVVELLHV